MKPGSSWAWMGVLPISRTIWDAFSIVLVDVDVPRMISTSFVSWAGLKKCMPTVLSLTEIFWEILSRLNVDVFDAIIAVAGATDSIFCHLFCLSCNYSVAASIAKLVFL